MTKIVKYLYSCWFIWTKNTFFFAVSSHLRRLFLFSNIYMYMYMGSYIVKHTRTLSQLKFYIL